MRILFFLILLSTPLSYAMQGIRNLSLAQKEGMSILGIGLNSCAAEKTATAHIHKSMLLGLLTRLENGSEPVALVINQSLDSIKNPKERRALLENYMAQCGNRHISYTFLSYAAVIAENNRKMLKENRLTNKNIHLIFQSAYKFRDVGKIHFSFGVTWGPPQHNAIARTLGFNTIAELEEQPELLKKKLPLLKEQMKSMKYLNVRFCDYLSLLDRHIEIMEQTAHSVLSASALRLAQQLRDYKTRIEQYCGLYSNDKRELLIDIFFKVIVQKNSIVKAYFEFYSYLRTAYPDVDEFEAAQLLASTSLGYKNVLYLDSAATIIKAGNFFRENGFSVDLQGDIPLIGETVLLPQDIPLVADEHITFSRDDRAYFAGPDPHAIDQLKFNIVMHKRTHAPGIFANEHLLTYLDTVFTDAHAIDPGLVLQQSTRFFNPSTISVQSGPYFDHTGVQCSHCTKNFAKKDAAFSLSDGALYCSGNCFAKRIIPTNPTLFELLKKDLVLNAEQIEFLEQCATLCFYRYITLIPGILFSKNYFFHLLNPRVSKKLSLLMEVDQQSPWARTCKSAQLIGIRVQDLQLWIEAFSRTKQAYRKELLDQMKGRSYKQLKDISQAPLFDSKGFLRKLQRNQLAYIKGCLGLKEHKADELIALIYKEILNEILTKLGLTQIPFESILDIHEPSDEPMNSKEQKQEKEQSPVSQNPASEILIHQKEAEDESEEMYEELSNLPQQGQGIVQSDPNTAAFKVHPSKKRRCFKELQDYFGGGELCTIKLYKARKFFELKREAVAAFSHFNPETWTNSFRVSVLFELANSIQETGASIMRNEYGMPTLAFTSNDCEQSIGMRLNIDHLFSQQVDEALENHGIWEELEDNLIQASIPGEINDGLQKKTIGFFQYTFRKKDLVCIHRSFARYDLQAHGNKFISKALRESLKRFLMEHGPELQSQGTADPAYSTALEKLAS